MLIRLIILGAAAAAAHLAANPAPAPQEVVVAPTATTQTYRVDTVHSSVIFRIKHLNAAYFYGRFNQLSGTIEWNADDPAASSLDLQIATASVDTANQNRDNHLRSADFFLAEEHPTISFRTTKIARKGDKFAATGELTLRGVTREIAVDLEHTGNATHRSGRGIIGLHSTFTIKRTDFDMPYGVEAGALSDEVTLMIGVEAIAQE